MKRALLLVALLGACREHQPPAFRAGTIVHHKADGVAGVVLNCDTFDQCTVTMSTGWDQRWGVYEIEETPTRIER